MHRGSSKPAQCFIMCSGAVALMYLEAVLWILLSQLQHQVITGHFRQNGRSGNVGAEAVTLDHRANRQSKILCTVSVDERNIGTHCTKT